MSGHKLWADLKKELGLENYVKKDVPLAQLKVGKYWKSWSIKYKKENPKRWKLHKKQRVKFGYSEYDWWSFDSYIAGVIAHACDRFASSSNGYPSSMTLQEWKNLCSEIAAPLKKWASNNRWELSMKDQELLYEQVQKAFHQFADHFGEFWD